MKSKIALFVAFAFASIASADFAVNLVNAAGYSATDTGVEQYTVQLIQNDGSAATTVDAGTLLGTGDNLVTSFTTDAGWAGTFNQGVVTSAAGTSGEIVIRIFESGASAGSVGSQFLVTSGTFNVYDSLAPATVHDADGVVDSPFTLGTSGTAVTVVPEPATIGLMGIAGAGLFAARRKVI